MIYRTSKPSIQKWPSFNFIGALRQLNCPETCYSGPFVLVSTFSLMATWEYLPYHHHSDIMSSSRGHVIIIQLVAGQASLSLSMVVLKNDPAYRSAYTRPERDLAVLPPFSWGLYLSRTASLQVGLVKKWWSWVEYRML